MSTGVVGVVLAAGASRRLGQPKALVELDGRSLLERTVANVTAATGEAPLVVLGWRPAALLAPLRSCHALVAINSDWEDGMGSSLAVAARAVPPSAAGVLVTVVDMPGLGVEVYRRLLSAFAARPNRPAAAGHADIAGVPAIFPAAWLDRLRRSSGTDGARALLRDGAADIAIELGSAALDIDTPEDLARIVAKRD